MNNPRILVVRVGALGDMLMVTPLLRALHHRYPEAEIDVLASSLAAPLLEYNPHLKNLFSLRNRNWPLALSPEKQRLIGRLRARRYDFAVLLEVAPRYRRLLTHVRPRRIASFSEVPFDAAQHAIVNNLRVAGIQAGPAEDLDMELPLTAGELATAELMLQDLPKPRIGVHIGWGPLGRKKRQDQRLRGWGHSNFIQLIGSILERHSGSVLLTGSPQDAKDTEPICRLHANQRLRSIAGRTRVRELAAVIKKLDLLVSVDSGPCHMAAALGTPLVVLWGPGRLEQTRPVSSFSQIRIVRHQVPCAPCQSTPRQKACRQNICMEEITPEEVFAEIEKLV
jgi:heptosyltransferase-2